jgi:hypothetical protein
MVAVIRLNGAFVRYNGKFAIDPDLCDCDCDEGECCCDNLTDLYIEATVGSCYVKAKMTREADGSYGGFLVRLWSTSLDLGGSTLRAYVHCFSQTCALGFYSDTCSGLPPGFDPYDVGSAIWDKLSNCELPQTFSRPGACNNATCGTGQTLYFTIGETAF